jgi:hypothetical protein
MYGWDWLAAPMYWRDWLAAPVHMVRYVSSTSPNLSTYLELGERSNGLCHLLLAQVFLQEFLQEHLDPGVGVLRRELAGLGVHRHAEAQHTERVPKKWKILHPASKGVRHTFGVLLLDLCSF